MVIGLPSHTLLCYYWGWGVLAIAVTGPGAGDSAATEVWVCLLLSARFPFFEFVSVLNASHVKLSNVIHLSALAGSVSVIHSPVSLDSSFSHSPLSFSQGIRERHWKSSSHCMPSLLASARW